MQTLSLLFGANSCFRFAVDGGKDNVRVVGERSGQLLELGQEFLGQGASAGTYLCWGY